MAMVNTTLLKLSFLNLLQNTNSSFCKGTKFKDKKNSKIRLIGNIILTYISRITCANNNITDVVNGFLCFKAQLQKK